MRLKNEQGVALIFSLFTVVILVSLSSLFVVRTVNEKNITAIERETDKSLYAAVGGAQAGLKALDHLINDLLTNTIASASPSGVVSYASGKVASGDGIGWLLYAVRENNVAVLTQNSDQAEYAQNGTLGGHNYQYNIIMTEKSDPVAVNSNVWDFPYNFRIESSGNIGNFSRKILLHGDFTVRVQKDNFAKYALFTNTQTLPSGTYVWFTNKTNFAGTIHTNARFNFALNPSGTFDGLAAQHDQYARFYNNGWPVSLDAERNGNADVPAFNAGFNRNVSTVTLTTPTQQQDMVNQAQGGQSFPQNGIYVPNSGGSLTGGIYVKGDSAVDISVDNNNNAVYAVTQGATTKTITIDRAGRQTTIVNSGGGPAETYNGIPDGMDDAGTLVYVDGSITGLKGTVQADTELTVAGSNDIVITNHLRYTNYTPAAGNPGAAGYMPPNADNTTNLLGLVSWNGNVRVGTSAPNDVNIHGTVLAKNGILQVDNYNDTVIGPRGTATLLGGVITNNYGAFGLFSGATGQQLSGYGRNFAYDERMQIGNAPPYFPTLDTFVAFTNDIADKLIWQEGGN